MISRESHYIQPVSARSEQNTANLYYSRIKAGWDDQNLITVRVILYHSNSIYLNVDIFIGNAVEKSFKY